MADAMIKAYIGLDHGAGHPLLFLDDAKAPNCQKNNGFNDLGNHSAWPKVAGAVIQAGSYMDPPALSRGSRVEQHASGQMQSYIRPLSEDLPWSSGPDEICASSPHHDRGLTGPVPTQLGGSRSDRSCHQLDSTSHGAEVLLDLSATSKLCSNTCLRPV